MAKKNKAEEHENLERWLVSYADFMTLLFATFVVLYALAQIDIQEYGKLEESIRSAFNSVIPLEGNQNILDGSGENILSKGMSQDNDAVIPPMLEYLNPKYEVKSMEDIKNEIDDLLKDGFLSGVSANITDRGLVITLKDINAFFASGSAELTPAARKVIGDIGSMIKKKFNNHLIRIEGHTDNLSVNPNGRYPSNWELSSARSASVARFLIARYAISANLFTVIGYGDTKPLASNSTADGRAKNRRIEIVILKNRVAKYEPDGAETISPNSSKKQKQAVMRNPGLSDAAQELLHNEPGAQDNVIILDEYNKADSDRVRNAINNFESGKASEKQKLNSKFH